MTPTEMADAIAAARTEVATWTSDPRDWGRADMDRAAEVWDRLDRLITDLTILRRDHGLVLARRVDDEFTALTRDGLLTVHRAVETSDQWDGDGVIDDMSEPLADANGEIVDAIRSDVLRDVLPACEPGATSSRWKVTAIRKRYPTVEKTRRRVVYGDAVIARGGKRSSQRHRKPIQGDISPGFGGQPVDSVADEDTEDAPR